MMIPHPIKLSDNPGAYLRMFLEKKGYSRVAVLSDENTKKCCYPLVSDFLPEHQLITVLSGEGTKTLTTCEVIWRSMTEQVMDRHGVLIVIGGGVLGDMGGFCASLYKRGIDFILMPTTLLAMVDASIGGKLGIDFKGFKNHIGVFKEPVLNLVHSDFLQSLPKSELRSGFAEIIKHALISDRSVWDDLRTKTLEDQTWSQLIRHSIEFKSSVVKEDPTEKGLRKILNAGHTVGHAIESYFLEKNEPILHGEAIAAGLICEAFISSSDGRLSEAERDEITGYILRIFGKIGILEGDIELITERCYQDKKNKGNIILAALLEEIGKAQWDCVVSKDTIVDSLKYYRSLQT